MKDTRFEYCVIVALVGLVFAAALAPPDRAEGPKPRGSLERPWMEKKVYTIPGVKVMVVEEEGWLRGAADLEEEYEEEVEEHSNIVMSNSSVVLSVARPADIEVISRAKVVVGQQFYRSDPYEHEHDDYSRFADYQEICNVCGFIRWKMPVTPGGELIPDPSPFDVGTAAKPFNRVYANEVYVKSKGVWLQVEPKHADDAPVDWSKVNTVWTPLNLNEIQDGDRNWGNSYRKNVRSTENWAASVEKRLVRIERQQ